MSAREVQGTVGLDLFMGRTLILDMPAQRVCLMERADLPLAFEQAASWDYGEISSKGKFLMPGSLNGRKLPRLLYDSGSSAAAVDVDLALWKSVTGQSATADAPHKRSSSAFGKELHTAGAPATGNLLLECYRNVFAASPTPAPVTFPQPLVTTTVERPTYYREQLEGDGVLGNALFLHSILILDLGAHPRFGIVQESGQSSAQTR